MVKPRVNQDIAGIPMGSQFPSWKVLTEISAITTTPVLLPIPSKLVGQAIMTIRNTGATVIYFAETDRGGGAGAMNNANAWDIPPGNTEDLFVSDQAPLWYQSAAAGGAFKAKIHAYAEEGQ